MNEKEYNGWTNYETWNVNLHLDEMYQRIANEHTLLSTYHLGQLLKDTTWDLAEEIAPDAVRGAGFVSDLFTAGLGEVNWYEIAEHYVEELELA